MAKKRFHTEEDHADEGWLLPYSDMMTLLLALFIVMFATSSVDKAQFNSMMESMYTAFGGTTEVGSPVPLPYPDAGLPNQPIPSASALEELLHSGGQGEKNLDSLFSSLSQYVTENGLEKSIQVTRKGEKVLFTIKNDIFFPSASAELSPAMREQTRVLATLLKENQNPEQPFYVVVVGHTDNVPIHTAQYPSNWHLSTQRALNFSTAMLEDTQLDARYFSIRGSGEYEPVASNDTAAGRQQNRRVEVLISQNNPSDSA